MLFNPDPSKPAQEVVFLMKKLSSNSSSSKSEQYLSWNNVSSQTPWYNPWWET